MHRLREMTTTCLILIQVLMLSRFSAILWVWPHFFFFLNLTEKIEQEKEITKSNHQPQVLPRRCRWPRWNLGCYVTGGVQIRPLAACIFWVIYFYGKYIFSITHVRFRIFFWFLFWKMFSQIVSFFLVHFSAKVAPLRYGVTLKPYNMLLMLFL